jgi:hypothetical protein
VPDLDALAGFLPAAQQGATGEFSENPGRAASRAIPPHPQGTISDWGQCEGCAFRLSATPTGPSDGFTSTL